MDSNPDAPHKFTPNADGLWVWDETGGTETVLGGVITGSVGSSTSAICVGDSGSKVIMNGGNIVGHKTGGASGGAVHITNGGLFTMNAGSIVGCTAEDGGGVAVGRGIFEMAGGVIKSCKAAADGGAVRVSVKDGTFTMTGGSIVDCTATNGNAIYLESGTMNADGGTVDGTVVLDVKNNSKGIIQGSGSNATLFKQGVTNVGEIKYGTFFGTVTLGNSTLSGTISGGIFNGTVTTDSEGEAEIGGGVFNKTVTINRGKITNGTFNKAVVVGNAQASFSCTTLTGGTYNGLIINKSEYAAFAGAHSTLGIVETKPSSRYSNDRYRTVTFDPAGGTMEYPVRYFLDDGNISDQIAPDFRAGYFFDGWYNGENKWNHSDTVGEDDLTLTAHWTVCDHSGHTGAQPTCTDTVICTACGGTIPALGHDWGEWTSNSDDTHTRHCRRDNTHTQTKDCFGGEATCREKAVCADCGKAYGNLDPANHASDGKPEWTQTKTTHEKKWSCCGVVTVASEAHEWSDGVCSECGYKCLHDDTDKNHICDICEKVISNHEDADKNHICDYCEKIISTHEDSDKNHICDLCGKVITNHAGGKATCKDKAVCEVCGKAYGELDANNHIGIRHIEAKAATEDAEGNIEYWYCEDCGKYYSDASASTEISKAAVVTAKLPSDTKSPRTGDSSNLALWFALLFIGGGAVIGTTVVGKKKKHNS